MKTGPVRHWGAIIVVLLATGYFLAYAWQHIHDLPHLRWGALEWLIITGSTLIWAVVIALGAIIWRSLLEDLGYPLDARRCVTIYALSQFGKYLPGNIGHHVGRVMLAREADIPVAVTAQTMLLEIMWAMGVAAGIALLGSAFVVSEGFTGQKSGVETWMIGTFLVGALVMPSVLIWLFKTLLPRQAERLSDGAGLHLPSFLVMLKVSLLFMVVFFLIGLVLDLQARYLFGFPEGHLFTLTTIFAWAWIAGFLSPGAPAGLGVREAILVSMLTPTYGPGIALGLSLSLRAATTFGDGLAFVLGVLAREQITDQGSSFSK